MSQTTYVPQKSARQQLEDFIGSRLIIPRPFNFSPSEPWTNVQQAERAIRQVKLAVGTSAAGQYKHIQFEKWEPVSQSPELALIGIDTVELEAIKLTRNSPLLKLAVKAFAEAAGQNPGKVTTCPALRAGFLGSVMNMIDKPVCIATVNQQTAYDLIHFARTAILQSSLSDEKPAFNFK